MKRLGMLCSALMVAGSGAAMAADPPEKLIEKIPKVTNAAQNATNVTAALQNVGFTGVTNAVCKGEFCTAEALWEDKPMKLRIELATWRIQVIAQ